MTDSIPSIISRAEAKALGLNRYFTGKECIHGHIAERFVSDSRCIRCRRHLKNNPLPAYNQDIKELWLEAKSLGLKSFDPKRPCRYGHFSHRYIGETTYPCIRCCNERDEAKRRRQGMQPVTRILHEKDDGTYQALPCNKCGSTERNKYKKCQNCLKRMRRDRRPRVNEEKKRRRRERPEWQSEQDKRAAIREKAYRSLLRKKRQSQLILAKPPWITRQERDAIRKFYKDTPEGCTVDHIIPIMGKNVCGLHLLVNLQYLPRKENIYKGNKFPWGDESEKLAIGHWWTKKVYIKNGQSE